MEKRHVVYLFLYATIRVRGGEAYEEGTKEERMDTRTEIRDWEWTLLVDTFNNEILAHQATPIPGNSKPYYYCLEALKKLAGKKNEEQTPHDQGSVYSSQAFCQAHNHYNILRSMS